jgi:hypothetical protein
VVLNFQYAFHKIRKLEPKNAQNNSTTNFLQICHNVKWCSVCKNISHISKFNYILFPNPTHKDKTRTTNRWEILLTETRLDQSNTLANQQQVLGCAVPFTSLSKLCKMLGQNHFAEPNWHGFAFLHPNLYFAGSHTEHWWSCTSALCSALPKCAS